MKRKFPYQKSNRGICGTVDGPTLGFGSDQDRGVMGLSPMLSKESARYKDKSYFPLQEGAEDLSNII